MKKIIIAATILLQFSLNAQWTDNGSSITTSDNVGIGTTNPSSEFEVKSNSGADSEIHINTESDGEHSIIRFQDAGQNTWGFLANYPGAGKFTLYNYQNNTNSMVVDGNGNVGIGTTNPSAKLDILGSIKATHSIGTNISLLASGDGNSYLNFVGGSSVSRIGFQIDGASKMSIMNNGNIGVGTSNPTKKLEVRDGDGVGIRLFNQNANTWDILNSQYGKLDFVRGGTNIYMRINQHGNIGIGTTDPGSWKLAVNGNIRAKEVKVETGWSDFVFYDNYELPTLEEVESYIARKGHLQDIPSAKEVEANGIKLGEMDSKLLQKIEELMLYTIQQEKKIKILESRLENLESNQTN